MTNGHVMSGAIKKYHRRLVDRCVILSMDDACVCVCVCVRAYERACVHIYVQSYVRVRAFVRGSKIQV